MKYVKGEDIINASEKAFRLIYEPQGYQPMEEADSDADEEADLADLNSGELKALAKEKGITGYSGMKKDELLALLSDKE